MGISAAVTSPTFNILLQYGGGRIPLYHFDLYRLDDADELEDIDFYGTIEGDGVSFVEWGSKFPEAMPFGFLEIRISSTKTARVLSRLMRSACGHARFLRCGHRILNHA